jgi:hypothetical protein
MLQPINMALASEKRNVKLATFRAARAQSEAVARARPARINKSYVMLKRGRPNDASGHLKATAFGLCKGFAVSRLICFVNKSGRYARELARGLQNLPGRP